MKLTKSMLAEGMFYLNGAPFSLDDYKHMRPVYDSDHASIVLNTSRQISKCEISNSVIRLASGKPLLVKDLKPGDYRISFDEKTHKCFPNKVKSVENNGLQDIYKITTRTGRVAKTTGEHPFWNLAGFIPASELKVGDLVGVAKSACNLFSNKKVVPDYQYKILGYLLSEGGLSSGGIRFSTTSQESLKDFSQAINKFDKSLAVVPVGDKYPGQYRITNGTQKNSLVTWLRELGLYGKTSQYKFHPEFIYDLTKKQTEDYLRIWWNTDGYWASQTKEEHAVGIGLISEDLIKGIQYLLFKLGIFTSISKHTPEVYLGTDKEVYVLRIEGQESLRKFYKHIKTYKLPAKLVLPGVENNNRHIIPKEPLQNKLNELKDKIGQHWGNSAPNQSWVLPYDLTYTKLKKYIDYTNDPYLKKIYEADIIYDRIIDIEILSRQHTTVVEMETPYNTFLIDGLVTHNSTTLANISIANSILHSNFRSLYVSPTVDQTKIFSNDRITPVLDQSPYIKKHLLSSILNQNVFTKQLLNHSKIYLRYALQSADRLRGISADMNLFDECYARGTEVLTNKGWILFEDLNEDNYKDFKYATVNNIQKLEFQKPSRFIKKFHSGKIVEFSHRSFKLRTTPNHNMYISQELNTGYYKDPKIKGWNFSKAADTPKNFKMISSAQYTVTNSEYFVIPDLKATTNVLGKKYQKIKEKFPIKVFMQFLGWYLAEGHVSSASNAVIISQKEGSNSKEIRECFIELFGDSFSEYKDSKDMIVFCVHNRLLHNYLKKLGKSHEKYIPEEILNYTEYLIYLLDALYKGDSMKHSGEGWGDLNTASKKLADTVQIAWLYLDKKTTIRQVTEKYNGTIMYRVRPHLLNYMIFWNVWKRKRIKYVDYNDFVFCVTVPNSTLIVRDSVEKTAVVCGNCQDLLPEIIPVVQETMARSLYKWSMFSGTPKTSTTTLAKLWRNSTKNEWMPKCPSCNKWNYLDDKNIGLSGVICRYCGKPLDPNKGVWVQTGDTNAIHQGFRISVLMFANAPWVDWKRDIIDYREQHSEGIFFNEKLGLEYDSGAKPITMAEVRACCTGGPMLEEPDPIIASKSTYLGIDYGPTNSKKSNTVVVAVQNEGEKIRVVYAKKYLGPEADYSYIHEDIPKKFKKWHALLIGADYGLGEAPNAELRKKLSFEKIIAYQHVPNQKERSQWNTKMPAFTLNRTQVMSEYFHKIKHRQIIFPRWEDFEPFANDILNINLEYDEERGKIRYTNNDPDDFFQALIYGAETALRHKLSSAEVY